MNSTSNSCSFRMISSVVLYVVLVGCMRMCHVAMPEVANIGETIKTSNRYAPRKVAEPLRRVMEDSYPEVFSPTGIPFTIGHSKVNVVKNDGVWTALFYVCSAFTFPLVTHSEKRFTYNIDILCAETEKVPISYYETEDFHGGLFSPVGLFFPYDPPLELAQQRVFYRIHHVALLTEKVRSLNAEADQRALAYAVAVRLKELEDAGNIPLKGLSPKPQPPLPVAQSVPTPSSASLAYTILSCERESGSGFAYRFVLELTDKSENSLQTFRLVQQDFRAAVKSDYADSYPNVNKDSLFVEFPEYKLSNGRIQGRAVVLTISVTSLTYDPTTRKGKLAVKVNANQYEEARKWIRKNIETLARDKNIALTTGEIPPAAKFYLGREELKDGNVLEIEFRTE